MYGAGNIGRGFIGQQFYEAGYHVIFIDVNPAIIDALNNSNRYPVKIVSEKTILDMWVENISAIDGRNVNQVADAIADADIMATAVGVNVLPYIMKPIAEGLKHRWVQKNNEPLNILLCENLIDSDQYFREHLSSLLNKEEISLLDTHVGFVRASIGRMVPIMTKERQGDNILSIWVEPYCKLPVDKDAIKGSIPVMKNLIPYSPFDFYIQKKLYIHNMGHALTAYLGQLYGFEYIWQAIGDPFIKIIVLRAMQESSIALSKQYHIDIVELLNHVDDLLYRFANPYLGDTIARVGKDPIRKLSSNDRLVGAATSCYNQGFNPFYISFGMSAALLFKDAEDENFIKIQENIKFKSLEAVIEDVCHIKTGSTLMQNIVYFYKLIESGKPLSELLSDIEYQKIEADNKK